MPSPPMLPPPQDRPSPQLAAEINRDFGSMDDFHRTLKDLLSDPRHGGYVWLVCTPEGRLRLVRTPPHVKPRGKILFQVPTPGGARPPRPSWGQLSNEYDRHMQRRPPIPMP